MTVYIIFLMQSECMCPRLGHVAKIGMDLLSAAATASPSSQGKRNQCVRSYIDGLFAFFFSTQRAAINIEDARWFLEIANKQEPVAASDNTCPFVNCTSLNVFKLYFSRILGNVDIPGEQLSNPQVD